MNGEEQNNQNQIKVGRVLSELEGLVDQGLVKQQDVLDIFAKERIKEEKASQVSTLTLQNVFYFVGAAIVILGVGIFVAQFWEDWGQIIKVVFALGLSALLYGIGYYLRYRYPKLAIFSGVSFILSVLLLPLGVGTFLDLINISAVSEGLVIGSAILFIVYFSSYLILKNDIFLLFSIIAGSGLFLSFINLFVPRPSETFIAYIALVLGASYLALGYYYQPNKKYIVNLLYLFGLIMFLGESFALSINSPFWMIVFPFLLAGTFYLSVVLQSRLILAIGTLFTFVEIGRLTTEYFSRSLGWPLALIIAGLAIIGAGYFSFEVSKRYFKGRISA